ncbi:MAG TPA: crotonase/enoyl-CoA hydratase family protein [bacterium]|nr:crotonase/enoyl-CoA hydratase family protein [bacterium]
MSEYKDIVYEVADRVAVLTLNMPDTRNSISGQQTIEEIEDACRQAQYDDEVSVLIITGAGKSFSSGGNVKAMRERAQEMSGPAVHLQERYRRGIQRIPLAVDSLDVPVIGAINGHAIGAGCDLAMMCDIRIASKQAVFGETFLNLGIIPGDGGSWFLVRQIGYQAAAELTFTGKIVDADEALRLGMVARVVEHDQLLAEAHALAKTIAAKPPRTLRLSKRILKQAQRTSLSDFLDICSVTQGIVQTSEDHKAAIEAFFEKTTPVFKGR